MQGCTPRYADMGTETREPAILETGSDDPLEAQVFVTRDGLELGLRSWQAEDPEAVVVALHGMNDYSRAFAMPGPRWAELGITTYAYDQRGFGRSPGTGYWHGSSAMRQDLADFVDVLKRRYPDTPVFVLGESMGGAVVMSALEQGPAPNADGYVLIAPAIWGWSALPFTHRAALWVTAHMLPGLTMTGRGLDIMPSDNIEMLRENARDPLFLKDTRSDSIYGLVGLMDEAYEAGDALDDAPVLLVYGGRDEIIPNHATEEVMESFGDNVTVKHYPEGHHMILRDLEAAPRWDDVAGWIAAHETGNASVDTAARSDAGAAGPAD